MACLRILLALSVLLLGACTSTEIKRSDGLSEGVHLGAGKSVVILEADIELAELLASGITETRADWTEAATAHVNDAIRKTLAQSQVVLKPYIKASDPKQAERIRQLELLGQAVGYSILLHEFFPYGRLPTKAGRFDWTIGPGARELRQHFDADYALVTLIRDSYASGGRKALMVAGLVGAVLGAGINVSLGQRIGYTSLIDLKTGKVIWSNLLNSATGDLRNAEDTEQAVQSLLKGLPL